MVVSSARPPAVTIRRTVGATGAGRRRWPPITGQASRRAGWVVSVLAICLGVLVLWQLLFGEPAGGDVWLGRPLAQPPASTRLARPVAPGVRPQASGHPRPQAVTTVMHAPRSAPAPARSRASAAASSSPASTSSPRGHNNSGSGRDESSRGPGDGSGRSQSSESSGPGSAQEQSSHGSSRGSGHGPSSGRGSGHSGSSHGSRD